MTTLAHLSTKILNAARNPQVLPQLSNAALRRSAERAQLLVPFLRDRAAYNVADALVTFHAACVAEANRRLAARAAAAAAAAAVVSEPVPVWYCADAYDAEDDYEVHAAADRAATALAYGFAR